MLLKSMIQANLDNAVTQTIMIQQNVPVVSHKLTIPSILENAVIQMEIIQTNVPALLRK